MKSCLKLHRLLLACVWLIPSISQAQLTNTVTFPWQLFDTTPMANRRMDVAPAAVGTNQAALTSLDWISYVSDANGNIVITNMVAGGYTATNHGPKTLTVLKFVVPSTNGNFQVSALTGVPFPVAGANNSYSMIASDLRYVQVPATNIPTGYVPTAQANGAYVWTNPPASPITNIISSSGISASTNNGTVTISSTVTAPLTNIIAGTNLLGSTNAATVTLTTSPALVVTNDPRSISHTNQANSFGGTFTGNGVGLTNTEGFNTNVVSISHLNTNVVTFTNASVPAFNGTWVWSIALNRYTNSGPYSIYYDAGDVDWYWTNGLGQFFYDSQPCVNNDEFTGFPYTTYINGPNSSQSSIATGTPPTGQYGLLSSNAIAYTQTQQQGPTSFGDLSVNSIFNKASGNVMLNPVSIAPNAMLGAFQCFLYGEDCFMGGGANNTVYGSGTACIGSAGCLIIDTGGESVCFGSETCFINTLHGVVGCYSSLNCTNLAGTVAAIIASVGCTINQSAERAVIVASENCAVSGLQVFMFGSGNTNYSSFATILGNNNNDTNSQNCTIIGNNNSIANAVNAGAIGNGLTNTSAGTLKVGITNANITYSNSTSIVTGGLGTTATNTYSITVTGFTNATARDIQLVGFTGTSVTYKNINSGYSKSLGTITSPIALMLKPNCALVGTSCASIGTEDL